MSAIQIIRDVAAVALGGAIGSVARWGAVLLGERFAAPGFPWSILAVNVVGCFLIGIISQWLPAIPEHAGLRLLLMTGFLGGLTTFSAFGHDTFMLLSTKPGLALANVGLNIGLGLCAVWLGVVSWRYLAA